MENLLLKCWRWIFRLKIERVWKVVEFMVIVLNINDIGLDNVIIIICWIRVRGGGKIDVWGSIIVLVFFY